LETFLVWVSSPALWASADWDMIGCSTDGILAAGVCFTRVNTVVFYAGLVTGTLIIMLTFPCFDFEKKQTKYKFPANSKEVSLTVLLTYFEHIA
jgi:hypothetical protein